MDSRKVPSIIRNNTFSEDKLVETDSGLMVPAYVGSQMGFNVPGRQFLQRFYQQLSQISILALCPFQACEEFLNQAVFDERLPVEENKRLWGEFNQSIGEVNYGCLMPHSKIMIALYDGSHGVDDGLSSEVAYFASVHGPVFGIRSDFRLGENPATNVNAAVTFFNKNGKYKGDYFNGPEAYNLAIESLESVTSQLIKNAIKRREIALPGFEPGSQAPKARRLDRYPTGLYHNLNLKY